MDRRQEWKGFQDWLSGWGTTEEERDELRELYGKTFGEQPPNLANVHTLAKAIYVKWYYMAEDRSSTYTVAGGKNHVTGEKERKRNLDGRRYKLLETSESSMHLQDQALVVHRELLKFQKACGRETISEAEVRTVMEASAKSGILKTKQDPFRIFQYYRGALQKANKLEMFE